MAWCREQMAAFKYPRLVEFRDALPMSATGKVLKRELATSSTVGIGRDCLLLLNVGI